MKCYYRLILAILLLCTNLAYLAASQDKLAFSWGVIFSSDQNIPEAKHEIDQLPRRLPQYQKNQVQLFKRRQWYASVVLFPTESDAKAARNIIDSEYSRGVIVVKLDVWCRPNWSDNTGTLQKARYYDCKSGEVIQGKTGIIITNIDERVDDIKSAQKKLEDLKVKLDKIKIAGKKSDFIDTQQDVTIFKKGNYFYIAVINYADQSAALKAFNARPGDNSYTWYSNSGKNVFNLNDWCDPVENKPNKDGYIQCKKSK